jgi:hypothetical protein
MNPPNETTAIETNLKMAASLASFLTGISYHGLPMMAMYKRKTRLLTGSSAHIIVFAR